VADLKTVKKYYNLCDPKESLKPDDARNEDLDVRGPDGTFVRGLRWVDRLARSITLADKPVQCWFTGLPGSGKSTELLRLAALLGAEENGRYLTVIADADDLIDLSSEVDVPDIIVALLYATERTVLTAEGKDPDDAMKDGAGRRLWNWLSRTDVTLGGAEVGLEGSGVSGKLAVELKTRLTARQRVRAVVASHLSAFLAEVHGEFSALQQRARKLGHAGLVVILDSLEKLQGMSTTFQSVLASAEAVFTRGAPYLELPVHTIYTVPPALIARVRLDDLWFIPMIKLADRAGAAFEPGYMAARRLIERRIPPALLADLFGAPNVDLRLRQVIAWSGGYPRDIIRMLRSFLDESLDGPINEGTLRRVLQRQSETIRQTVPDYAFPWLAEVALGKRLPLANEDQRQVTGRMLQNNLVMRYQNDEGWFDLHPAVASMPEIQRAVETARATWPS